MKHGGNMRTRKANEKRELENFCAQSESDCDTNELFWLSPLPIPVPVASFPFSLPIIFAGQVAVLGLAHIYVPIFSM